MPSYDWTSPSAVLVLVIIISGTLAVVSAAYFVWNYAGSSQTLALATAAFVGTFLLLVIQAFFEFKGDKVLDRVYAEYTVDKALPEVASAFYSMNHPGTIRAIAEKDISASVAKANRKVFDNEPEKLAQDMAMVTIISMLFKYQPDWQLRVISAASRYTFGYEGAEHLSQDAECTKISASEMSESLTKAGNVFAQVNLEKMGMRTICVPPNSKMKIESRSISFETPFCIIVIEVEKSIGQIHGRPELMRPGMFRTIQPINMPDGTPRYTSMPIPLKIRIDYRALSSRHQDMDKVRAWAVRLTSAMHAWFEGTGSEFIQFKSPLEADNTQH